MNNENKETPPAEQAPAVVASPDSTGQMSDALPCRRSEERPPFNEVSVLFPLLSIYTTGYLGLMIADFSRSGRVICLLASEDEILRRVSSSSARPLLEKGDKLDRIKKLMEQRRPLYESIHDRVNTTGLRPEEVVEVIMLMLME